MLPGLQICKIFDKDITYELLDLVQQIEDQRWANRNFLPAGRRIDNSTCDYYFCGHSQMERSLVETFKTLAPRFDDFELAEIAVNKYKVDNFLGKHKDRHRYRKNMVISLQENGDGIYIDNLNLFIEDKAGQAVVFDGIDTVHSVPPVKCLRYTLIYLYE